VRAIEVAAHGGPEVLVTVQREIPVPAAAQVLVRNEFIGVNYVDVQHRAGRPYPVELPFVPGTEAAGTVVDVGAGVDGFEVGQGVVHFGHLAGVYADFTAVPVEYVLPVPDGIGMDVAAAVALQGTTAHVLTRTSTRVGAGRVVVVHAAAGGTGSAVTALATAAGAQVIGVVSSADKRAYAVAAGAATVVVNSGGDLAAAIRGATGGRGADFVFDAGGAATLDVSLKVLGDFGTLVLYGQSSGIGGVLDTGRLSGLTGQQSAGSLTVKWVAAGHYLRSKGARQQAIGAVFGDVAAGVLRPYIAASLQLEQAAQAHRMLEGRTTVGKILLNT
jgi:NADPH2:quinone reductase